MRDDFRSAIRTLRGSKTFTAVAIAVLALGIGATTAIFSVVDAVVLRALPFDEHDRLVAVGERNAGQPVRPGADPLTVGAFEPQNYIDVAAGQQVFEAIAAVVDRGVTLRMPGAAPEDLSAERVTADFFRVLHVGPALGGTFTVANEVDGRDRVCVLSDAFWRTRFAGDPTIVGRTIPLEGGAYTVVGVMGADLSYPVGAARPAQLWLPYVVPPNDRVRNPSSRSFYLQSIARLKPGVSLANAQANLDQIAQSMTLANPEWNKNILVGVRPLRDHIVDARTTVWMWMLLGAVGLVLLIACANVANLLLARATVRDREVGIRAALGASRWQLVRQLLIESLLLSIVGTAVALLLAYWGVEILRGAIPQGVPRVSTIAVDLRVLGMAAALALLTGLAFGIVPALQLSKPRLANALRDGSRGASAGRGRQYLRSVLVVVEVSLAVVLLVGAALFIGSFRVLMGIDPGFVPDHVLTASVQLPGGPTAPTHIEDLVERIAGLPDVRHAAAIASGGLPMGRGMTGAMLRIPGRSLEQRDTYVGIHRVTPDYFRALSIPVRLGRPFTTTDRNGAPGVVVISEAAARKYFPGGDAIGQAVVVEGDRTVVGVVGDVRAGLERAPGPDVYVPVAQGQVSGVDLVVQAAGDPYAAVAAVKAATFAVLPDSPVRFVQSMDDLLAQQIASRRFNMMLLSLFGLVGLVISAVGIYGVMAYLVAQREREIGVRIALGATASSVMGLVLGRASVLVGLGLVLGTAGAYALSGTAKAFLFRMQVTDPRAYASAAAVLAAAALIATIIPARRAARVDPIIALRSE